MIENGFIRMSEELFEHIEDQINENGWDFDYQFTRNTLTIEAVDGAQTTINRHVLNQELWITARSGGCHFAEQNSRWLATCDGRDFYDVLNGALSAASGEAVEIAEL